MDDLMSAVALSERRDQDPHSGQGSDGELCDYEPSRGSWFKKTDSPLADARVTTPTPTTTSTPAELLGSKKNKSTMDTSLLDESKLELSKKRGASDEPGVVDATPPPHSAATTSSNVISPKKKIRSSSSQPSSGVSSEPQQLIHDLLEALTSLNEDDLNSASSTNTVAAGATSTSASAPTKERNAAVGVGAAGARRQLHLSRSSSANDMVVQETEEQSPMESESSKVPGSGDGKSSPGADKAADEAAKKKKPLMSKSMICKLLAEFVRSYAGCAKLVTEHHYVAGTNERITEDCSALAYMLDHLVCSNSSYEKDTAGHVRVLIAALSSCNHAPEAQTILVTEVKGALGRATILTESPEKHGKVQALVGLICTMMEACPAQLNQPPNLCFKQQQLGMNNMIRVMVRKGLVTDMARIPHSLDFSSPNMATTINAALKPLELVSRIVNLPSFVPVSSSKKKNPSTTVEESAAALGTGTTNSEATRAQGDDNTEDAENTEHDISVAGESLEPTSDAHPNEDGTLVDGDETGLEMILDQLLEDGGDSTRTNQRTQPHRDTVTATVTYVIDHDDPPMDTDDTLHDSQMVTHSESQFLEDHEDGQGNEDQDDDSSSETSEEREDDDAAEEDEDEDVEEEEEEEDDGDDDEDEEEEEEGSVYDEGYEDLEEAFIRLPGDRDTDDILLLPSYQQYIDTIDTIIFGDRVSLHHQNNHEDPSYITSTPNANPSGSSAIPAHPLFQNPREVAASASGRINNRPSRQRGVLRYHTVTPRTHTTTTTILQRLLGPSHRDVLQLTSNLREATQVLFTNPDVRLMPPDPDEYIDMQDHGNNVMNNTGSSASLANVPNALSRWTEETRVLEADSMHDSVTAIKPALMAVLERYKDSEQAEREKKKKEAESAKPPTTTPTQGPLSTADTEMGETVETSSADVGPTQESAAMQSTASIAESIVESVLSSSTGPLPSATSAAPPSFSGLLTLLSPVTTAGPQLLALQEPTVAPVPASVAANLPSAPITPQPTNVRDPTLPSPITTSTPTSTATIPLPTTAVAAPAGPEGATSSSLTANDTEMVSAASPLPAMNDPSPPMDSSVMAVGATLANTAAAVVAPTLQEASLLVSQEETPMSVSPPEYPRQSPDLLPPASVDSIPTPPLPPEAPREVWEQAGGDQPMPSEPSALTPTDASGDSLTTTGATDTGAQPQSESDSGAGPSGRTGAGEYSAILGDIEIPDGVDPSFLAALPEEMRSEVIAEQLRLQRARQRPPETAAAATTAAATTGTPAAPNVGEVNPEFLAALPPNIQEEVLAQQRLEQQRQQSTRSNPDDPMDPVSFLQTLPPSLRQTILADLEESQFASLPPELAQEAQTLRRQREERNRHVQEHMFRGSGGTSLSSILRNTARIGSRLMHSSSWNTGWNLRPSSSGQQVTASTSKPRGRQLLDHEAMTCLLVLLFVDEPKLNTTRLHRVLRYLCHHPPTREWVIKALLSIIERCADPSLSKSQATITVSLPDLPPITPDSSSKSRKVTSGKPGESTNPSASTPVWRTESRSPSAPTWLSMSMDAALGCRANIFQIQKGTQTGKRTSALTTSVNIHPQASPLVCRHALDTLISLAKSFPSHFLPYQGKDNECDKSESGKKSTSSTGAVSKSNKDTATGKSSESSAGKGSETSSLGRNGESTDFWELLVRLDSISVSRKGKGLPRSHSSAGSGASEEENKVTSLDHSALGQLIQQLAHPVIRRSSLLTDRLLRLLALISLGLPETADNSQSAKTQTTENTETLEHLLSLAIQVLTSKSCSEEGLEDATALLLHLSHGPPPARDQVLRLLLQGAATLGATVAQHIADLLKDLRNHNEIHPQASLEDEQQLNTSADKNKKGLLTDRFTNERVIISGTTKMKPPCELQLASMSALTSKTSSQAFFLRTLKVIIQLRDAIRLSRSRRQGNQQSTNPSNRTTSNNQAENNPESQNSVVDQSQSSQSEETESSTQPSQVEAISTAAVVSPTEGENESEAVSVTLDVPNVGAANINSAVTSQGEQPASEAMDVDNDGAEEELGNLSGQLGLEELWSTLSSCLVELGETPDTHAVLVLQPAVEAFFLVHASNATTDRRDRTTSTTESREAQLAHLHHEIAPLSPLPNADIDGDGNVNVSLRREHSISQADNSDTEKFLKFAETHRTVLNQILRQSTVHLADGPFSVLVDHTRLLDFDIKRKYFRTELERADDGMRREDLAVHVRREHVFEDSFRELHRRSQDEWKNRFYIVFEGEEGQDAGGLLREWYMIISREIFNPMYALFCTSPGDRVTYMINSSSHCNSNHLSYFKFVGRVIAKAIYDNKLLECYFTRSFYKHILGKMVRVADMESEDYSFYQGLNYLMEHLVADLGYDLNFSTEVQEFGITEVRDLKPNGRNIIVNEENKQEYIRLVCQMKMTGAIRKQLNAYLEGFYDIIPKRLISIFNEQELELLISGLPTVDIDDLRANTEYHKFQANSLQIQWFWRALRSFDQAERAKFLQFVTGTSKVPLQGFAALEGMNGTQKFQIHRDDRSTDRLPSAHTCFNQLDLPVYETYDKLRHYMLKAIHECSEGFGFA